MWHYQSILWDWITSSLFASKVCLLVFCAYLCASYFLFLKMVFKSTTLKIASFPALWNNHCIADLESPKSLLLANMTHIPQATWSLCKANHTQTSNNAPSRAGKDVFLSLSLGFEQVAWSHLQALLSTSSLLPDSPDQTDPCNDGRGENKEQWCLAAPSFLHPFLLLPTCGLLKLCSVHGQTHTSLHRNMSLVAWPVATESWDFHALL